ncbi:MAG TPA: VTT domain-containing protein, partial [Hyphomicrobiaceae bacterium]|nr:VTT domain-containing protein [Hyphomicrobiaceae bacterium]
MPPPDKTAARGTALKRFGPLVAVAAAMAAVFVLGWHNHLTLDNIIAQRDRFHSVLAQHSILSVAAYMAIYVLSVALSLPGGLILTVAGGLLFGSLIGGLAAVVAATAGATIVFLIARTAVGETFSARAGPWLAKLSVGFKEEALSYMLFLRLVPAFPFWFVNIAPAVLGVPLG